MDIWLEPGHPDQYNIAAIRNLLRDAFTAEDLRRFCQDRPDFRPVLTRFGSNASLENMIDVLLEYCRTQMLFPELLSEIQEANPKQYRRSSLQLGGSVEPSASRIPHNLPRSSAEFVGREAEKAQVHEALLSRSHLVCINGIGGIGKTALAREVAHECLYAGRGERSSDGIATFEGFIWTTAKDRDLSVDDLLDSVARALDDPGIVQRPAEEKQVAVRRLLQTTPYLLVVDNYEKITDESVRDFLLELPEPSKALITSREQEWPEAEVISLTDLSKSGSLALMRIVGQRLKLKSVELADDEVLSLLYQSTGGVPLAIEWAVGQIKQKGQSLDRVLAALDRVTANIFDHIFARSWSLLSTDAQQVLMVMPLFAASASRAGIEAASGVHDFTLDEALGQLVEMFLVDATDELTGRRYSIHPLTRAFAIAACESERGFVQSAFERILTYYRQLVMPPREIQVGDPYWDGLLNYSGTQSLKAEWDNLAHIIRRLLDGKRDEALDLFLPVIHLLSGWGAWNERLQLSREMCKIAHRLGKPSEAWLWIDGIGYILREQRQFDACLDAIEEGRAVAERFELVDALILADAFEIWVHSGKGNTSLAQQKVESVLKQLDRASALGNRKVHQIVACRAIGAAAALSLSRGDLIRAKELFEREIELRHLVGEHPAPMLTRLGHIYLRLEDVPSAEESFRQALDSGAGQKDVAWINYGLALLAERNGEQQEAQYLGELALEQVERLGIEDWVRECQEFLAGLSHSTTREDRGANE